MDLSQKIISIKKEAITIMAIAIKVSIQMSLIV